MSDKPEPSYVKYRPTPRDSLARWQTYADYLEREVERLRAIDGHDEKVAQDPEQEKKRWAWRLQFDLPDIYDPDELAQQLRELADMVEGVDLPPTGHLWGPDGRLLARAALDEDHD